MKNPILLIFVSACILACNAPTKPENVTEDAAPVVEASNENAPLLFADSKYSDVCKAALASMTSGDIDGFTSAMADNCVYRFNNGDSISGKPAIQSYWKERRTKFITKIDFSNDLWLPVTVTESNKEQVRKGTWVLGWFTTAATYSSGKSMQQSMHTLYHFNQEEKIDEVIQYLDRASINAAMK